MKRALVAFAVVLAVWAVPRSAAGLSFSYSLSCPFGGDPTQPECGGTTYGTITFTDSLTDADTVDIVVDLIDSDWTIGQIYWNIDSALALTYNDPGGDADTFNDGSVLNDQTADGYSGLFDISLLAPPGPAFGEPYSFSVTGTGLTASNFNVLDSGGLVFAAVHIQACGESPELCPAGSIYVGAETDGGTGGPGGGVGPGGVVPEPASLLLLGSGLALAASRFRRRRQQP